MPGLTSTSLFAVMVILGSKGEITIGDGYLDLKGLKPELLEEEKRRLLYDSGFGYVPWLFCWRYPKERIPKESVIP